MDATSEHSSRSGSLTPPPTVTSSSARSGTASRSGENTRTGSRSETPDTAMKDAKADASDGDGSQTPPAVPPSRKAASKKARPKRLPGLHGRHAGLSPSPAYREMSCLYGHARGITCLTFSPDGSRLASSAADKVIKIWSVRTGAIIHTLESHTGGVNEVAWSKDSNYLASVSDDRTVKLWNARTGTHVKTLLGHTSYVMCVAFNPQGTLVATGGFDETLKFWDLRKPAATACHRSINAHTEAVSSVDFNRDGLIAVTGSYDGLIRLWDVSSGQCLKTLESKLAGSPVNTAISSVLFSPSSVQLLASSLDNKVRLWDVPNGRVLKTYTGHQCEQHIMKAAFTSPRFVRPGPTRAEDVDLPDAAELADEDREAIVERRLAVEQRRQARKGLPEILIACGSEDQKVVLWDLQTKEVVQTLEAHRDTVIALAVHPFLPIIASGCLEHDPTIRLWLDVSQDAHSL